MRLYFALAKSVFLMFAPAYALLAQVRAPDASSSVTAFGARCDGRTDDHDAVQAAFDHALAPPHAPVIFPQGKCRFSTVAYSGQSFHGVGDASILLSMPGEDLFIAKDDYPIRQDQQISDLKVDIDASIDLSSTSMYAERQTGDDLATRPPLRTFLSFPMPVGNCFMAFPEHDGTRNTGTLVNAHVHDIFIEQVSASPFIGRSCGFFFQSLPYNTAFENIDVYQTFYGFVAAPPFLNRQAGIHSGDANEFRHISITTVVPFLWYNGAHTLIDGMSLYGANRNSLGLLMLEFADLGRSANSSWTVRDLYYECWSNQEGEISRITGRKHLFLGGSLTQCGSKGYVSWYASESVALALGIGSGSTPAIEMNGFNNTFQSINADPSHLWNDHGINNSASVLSTAPENISVNSPPQTQISSSVTGSLAAFSLTVSVRAASPQTTVATLRLPNQHSTTPIVVCSPSNEATAHLPWFKQATSSQITFSSDPPAPPGTYIWDCTLHY